jgi:signal transduction histidine kinase
MMLPEAEKAEKNVKPLKAIIRSSERVPTRINDILDLARVEAGEMKLNYSEVDIDHLVRESFRAVQFNAEQKRIRLLYEQENGPRTLMADDNKLFQVLNNLLGNAIKFTPEEGVVTVRKSSDNGNLLMTVSDTGPGLDQEQQKSIFEKFKQAGDHHGSGLGLAICKNLVELQNGKIWVESEPGKGANFKFTIPVRREENAEKSAGD